ncbi:MAG: Uma2 family endonuclease [Chloroflexia bacterium]|nr:Uma2 family endonuclease [Chloroflexia bacterium]
MVKTVERTEAVAAQDVPAPVTLRLRPVIEMTPDQLLEISSLNRDLRLEMTAEGELIVMAPAGTETGWMNGRIGVRLGLWAERDGTGVYGDSSTGFTLNGNAVRSPDASWVLCSRLDALSPEQRRKYAPLCPDFVIELRSPSDRLSVVQAKMREWLDNGARLGWLLDPDHKRVYVYQPDTEAQQLDDPKALSGDPVLPGFVLNLDEVW